MNRFSLNSSQERKVLAQAKVGGIIDRPLNKTKSAEVSLSAFAFLFSEIVQYSQKKVTGIPDLERRLGEIGYRVGLRMGEMLSMRIASFKRETKLISVLTFIHTPLYKSIFGKPFDSLERSTEAPDEYMLIDNEPLISKYITVPKDFGQLNVCAYLAGFFEAVLEGYGMNATVTAHSTPANNLPLKTTFLIKFDASVTERENESGR
jgi:hypothetical protein